MKDPKTPAQYAVDAMNCAVGALRAVKREGDQLDNVISQLIVAIEKFDTRCDHEWSDVLQPMGGVQSTCQKCGTTRNVK